MVFKKSKKTKLPQKITERATRLLKMATALTSEAVLQTLQSARSSEDSWLNQKQIQILVQELGQMKGAAMKFGQLLALEARDYFPEEICKILDTLQSQVSAFDLEEIQPILQQELPETFHEIKNLSPKPIAAASIGQVHSAQIPSGKSVVVKIQYPGIRESIHSDLQLLSTLFKTLSFLLRKKVDFKPLLQTFSRMLFQEADYEKEAYFLKNYQTLAQTMPNLILPSVHERYCSSRVLTLDFCTGQSLTEWVKKRSATLQQRTFYGNLLLELYCNEFCRWGLVQTDPNLGNFLFQPQHQKLVLLDFGATQEYSLEFRKRYAQLIMATAQENKPKILELSESMQWIDTRESEEVKTIFQNLLLESMRPILAAQYNFSDTQYPETMRKITRSLIKNLKFSAPPEALIFLHRKLSGIFYMLRTLQVTLNLKSYLEYFEALASESST